VALVVIGVLWREGVREPEDAQRLVQPAAESADADGPQELAARAEPGAQERLAGAQERREAESLADGQRFRRGQPDTRGVEPRAAPAAAKALPPSAMESLDAAEEGAGRRANADDLLRGEAREDMAAAAGRLELQALDRFELSGRDALVRSDTLAAARALGLWRDSVASRTDLPPDRRRAASVLADSLAELVGSAEVPPQ
jgi:hypothetical protein